MANNKAQPLARQFPWLKRIFVALFILALLISFGFIFLPDRRSTAVVGDFAPKDLAEIKRTLHRQIWKDTLPGNTFKSFKQFPGAIARNLRTRITSITMQPDGSVHAFATFETRNHRSGRMNSFLMTK